MIKSKKIIQIKKFIRFIGIYGLNRALNKALGRARIPFIKTAYLIKKNEVGLIGCGQFQFATIAYFLARGIRNRFDFCYDIDEEQSRSLAYYYRVPNILKSASELASQENIKKVYIASNHASHTSYAVQFLNKGIDVYCEKPISVSFEQFQQMREAIKNSTGRFFAGYNRPHSQAVKTLRNKVLGKGNNKGVFTINCFISAHDIPMDHWYRNEEEGTRICGNVGHWLDLMIHMYNWRGSIPAQFLANIAYSNLEEPDDNITISLTNDLGDLTSITITARSEPFEGINETISFQYDTIIAKIDDFRRMTIWDDDMLYSKRYWPKDVGHKSAVMQPYNENDRDINEVLASTELMLHLTDMVRNKQTQKEIKLNISI